MKETNTSSARLSAHAEIATDSDGRLYQPRVREDVRRRSAELGAPAQPPTAGIEAVAALRLAAKTMHLGMERWAEEHGLSEGRLQVLFCLRFNPEGTNLGTLARLQHVSPRNITGLVDILERDGLVERVPDLEDRRSINARLTDSGRARINSIWKQALAQSEPLTRGFSDRELVELRHLCLRLVQNLDGEIGGVSL